MLADGHDAVTVQAWAIGDPGSDVHVRLTSGGFLTPGELVIKRHAFVAEAKLTSDHPGEVRVELMDTEPPAQFDARTLTVMFGAPVSSLRLEAHPAQLSLVDESDLVVQLVDGAGRSVATDKPRTIALTLDDGHGEIANKELTIVAGASEARTRFVPTGTGTARVSARFTSLLTQETRLDVRLPVTILVLTLMGGLIGGLLAWLRKRHKHVMRIVTGGITGFLLYWSFIFGLLPVLPRAYVLNPLGCLALSTVGGWLGTDVFSVMLKRFGLMPETGKPKKEADKEPGKDADEDKKARAKQEGGQDKKDTAQEG